MRKKAKADIPGLRQQTQYTCMATSLTSILQYYDKDVNEKDVNKVLGASAKKGARWEEALGTLQYFGLRGSLVVPATLKMVKNWTDKGIPVMIAWNPEGRPWSHASVISDVDDDLEYITIMDPNIPDPEETFRQVPKKEFYRKWGEDWGDMILRRPAVAVTLEVDAEGRQVVASSLKQPLSLRRDYGLENNNNEDMPMSQKLLSMNEFKNSFKKAKYESGENVSVKDLPEELQKNVEDPPEKVKALKEKLKNKKGKYESGENVSVKDLPEELQKNVEDPPEKVKALKEKLKAKKATVRNRLTATKKDLPPEFVANMEDPPESVKIVKEKMESKKKASQHPWAQYYLSFEPVLKSFAKKYGFGPESWSFVPFSEKYLQEKPSRVSNMTYIAAAIGINYTPEMDSQNDSDITGIESHLMASFEKRGAKVVQDFMHVLARQFQKDGHNLEVDSTLKGRWFANSRFGSGSVLRFAIYVRGDWSPFSGGMRLGWAKGQKVPKDKLPPEFVENIENPPEGVLKLREEMKNKKKAATEFVTAAKRVASSMIKLRKAKETLDSDFAKTGSYPLEKEVFSSEYPFKDSIDVLSKKVAKWVSNLD